MERSIKDRNIELSRVEREMIHVRLKSLKTSGQVSQIMPSGTETIDVIVQQVDGNRVVTSLRQPITKPSVSSSDVKNAAA